MMKKKKISEDGSKELTLIVKKMKMKMKTLNNKKMKEVKMKERVRLIS